MLYSVHKKERGFYVTRGIGPQVCFFFFAIWKAGKVWTADLQDHESEVSSSSKRENREEREKEKKEMI